MPDKPTVLTTIKGAPIIIYRDVYDADVYGEIVCGDPGPEDMEKFVAELEKPKPAPVKKTAKKASR